MVTVEVPPYETRKSVKLGSRETAVVVVDMQNDFVDPKGALFVPASRKTIEPIRKLVERARAAGAPIVFTRDWHLRDDPEFQIWGRHAVSGTWGAEIVEDLKPREGDIIIDKLRYDAFFGTSLDHILRLRHIRNLVITGTVANICVLHTAASGALNLYKIYVPLDSISALNDFDYYIALRQISFLYRGILVDTAEGIEFT